MKKILTPFLAILLIAASCKKTKTESESPDQLPPITQTGANTFGCLINGNVWLPKVTMAGLLIQELPLTQLMPMAI